MLLLIKNFLLFFIIIIFQILMPSIAVFHIEITPDLILILGDRKFDHALENC